MAVTGYAVWKLESGLADRSSLNPLQIAELAAAKYGFFDVDVKDNDNGILVTIEARGLKRATVRAKGKSLEEAVSTLVEKFFNGN